MSKIRNRLKIGEFSRLCRVTVRTLRHYEEIGLLVPQIVDRSTGYRYYAIEQLQKMQDILRLKELGFSLEEIRDLWEESSHAPSIASLEEKARICEAELGRLRERQRMLGDLIASRKKMEEMERIQIESLPAITVASHRTVIPSYQDIGRLCYEVIGPEMARIGCECAEPGYCFTVEYGGYKPQDIDIEYCEQVKCRCRDSAIIKFKELPAVPTAACMKVYGSYDRLYQGYLDLFAWIEKEGWRICGDIRANYVDGIWNQEDSERWLTVIQVPVERA